MKMRNVKIEMIKGLKDLPVRIKRGESLDLYDSYDIDYPRRITITTENGAKFSVKVVDEDTLHILAHSGTIVIRPNGAMNTVSLSVDRW